jgi:uncharacterized protein
MKEIELEQFLLNTKVDASMINNFIRDEENKLIPKRQIFDELKEVVIDSFTHKTGERIVALSGLRGVGKTTLMWQMAKEIYDHYSTEIYFFNIKRLTELGEVKLNWIFSKFEDIVLKKKFHELQERIVFLFDEVHDAENWSAGLKILYDMCKRAFVVCTGSSALLLQSNADLATRWSIYRVFPFSFPEFIRTKSWQLSFIEKSSVKEQILFDENCEKSLKEILFFSSNIKELQESIKKLESVIRRYMDGVQKNLPNIPKKLLLTEYINYYNIPRLFYVQNKIKILDKIIEMFDSILFEDVLKWLDTESEAVVMVIKKILYQIATSNDVNIEKLSVDTGCKKKDAELFIDSLTKAEVLNLFFPYGSIKTKINKHNKLFFMSPTLRVALCSLYGREITTDFQAILYEEIVAMYLKRLFPHGQVSYIFSKEDRKKCPDFVIETRAEADENPVILEVKTSKTSTDQIVKSGIKSRYNILVVAEAEDSAIVNDTLILPLSWFLLL